jgi:hypothetical protein
VDQNPANQDEYVRRVLEVYRKTPGTMGTIRGPDRLLAVQLHQRGVPLAAVENAFVLAVARRLIRPADSAPLGAIRSLAYFLPVIHEVLSLHVNPDYFRYLRQKVERAIQTPLSSTRPSQSDLPPLRPARLRRG